MWSPTIPISIPAGFANGDLIARDVLAIILVRAKLKLFVAEVAAEHDFMCVHLSSHFYGLGWPLQLRLAERRRGVPAVVRRPHHGGDAIKKLFVGDAIVQHVN